MKYTNITLAEMKAFLGPKFVELPAIASTKEYVFEYKLPESNVVVKVYTSIHRDTGDARKCGGDAIRVCAVDIIKKIGWIKTTRVFRVEGWRKNLGTAINSTIDQSYSRIDKIALKKLPTAVPATPVKVTTSLREINLQIKTATRPAADQELVDFIWGKVNITDGQHHYAAEASTLDANKENRRRDLCPKCDGIYSTRNLIQTIEHVESRGTEHEERETQGWEFKCPHCGAFLTVFND